MIVLAHSGRAKFWLTQIAVVAGGVVLYFGVRALTQGDPRSAAENAERVIAVERHLGFYAEQRMQDAVLDSDRLSTLANWIYIWGHWPVIIAVLIWLGSRNPDRFLVYRDAMLISGAVGMVIFATFPVTPPRLMDVGLVDVVSEESHAYRALQPPSVVNQYAAMPSFHVGWNLLVGIAMVREGRWLWQRVVGCLLPVAMSWSVVVTANHYLLDGVVGVVIVLAALAGATRLHQRRMDESHGGSVPAALDRMGRRGDRGDELRQREKRGSDGRPHDSSPRGHRRRRRPA